MDDMQLKFNLIAYVLYIQYLIYLIYLILSHTLFMSYILLFLHEDTAVMIVTISFLLIIFTFSTFCVTLLSLLGSTLNG